MNIWDSVQRGLEKATQEATRIAKAQRLRSSLEGLSKQIEAQQGAILGKAMELFQHGQLTQNELFILCQELHNSQQQFVQAQNELKVVQSQSNQGNQGTQLSPTVAYTQQPYQPYDETLPALVAPPPPGVAPLTVSSLDTMRMAPPPPSAQTHCVACQAILIPGNAFCHNCGTPVHTDIAYQPTMRGSVGEDAEARLSEKTVVDIAELGTIRAKETDNPVQEKLQDGGI